MIDPDAPIAWDDADDEPEAAAKATRRGKLDPESKRRIQEAHAAALARDASIVRAGVSVTWLATAFKMDLRTTRNRLGALKPIGRHGPRNSEVYDFVAATGLLAKPPADQFARYMKTLRVQDLPTHLQESYWGALRKKQIWEQHAGELWKTDDVIEVFGEVFKTMKSSMQLWVDDLDKDGDMSGAQRTALTQMVDGLMDELHRQLVEMPGKRQTRSSRDDPDANPDSLKSTMPVSDDDEDLIG